MGPFDGTVCSEIPCYDFFTNAIRNWIDCGGTIVRNDDAVIDILQRTLQVRRANKFRVREFFSLGW